MARETFLFYLNWAEPISELSNESKCFLIDGLLKYVKTGEIIDMPADAKMAFRFMKIQIDIDAEKYKKTCAARAEAGRIGGQKSKTKQDKQMIDLLNKPKQTKAKQPDNEYDNEYDNDVVVETTTACARTRDVATTPTTGYTKEKIDSFRAQIAKKFYVPGRSDAQCRAALIQARKFANDKLKTMADGNAQDCTLNGDAVYVFDSDMDIAVGYRVLAERIVAAWDNGSIKGAAK